MLELYFFNVGHGDSIAIKFPNDEWGIIDCKRNRNTRDPNVLKFLKIKNIKKINFLAVTHFHEDHYKGIDAIADYYKDDIKYFILPSYRATTKTSLGTNNLTSLKKALNIIVPPEKYQKLQTIEDGNEFYVGDIKINLYNPNIDIIKECYSNYLNNSEAKIFNKESLVMGINYGEKQILLTGDSTADIWNFKGQNIVKADIIKISHHGSIENNPNDLLNNLIKNNCISIISSDGNITYPSIPSKKVIEFLENSKKSKVLKTYELTSIENISNTSKGNKIINCIMTPKKTTDYDGYYKVTISENGKISTEKFANI